MRRRAGLLAALLLLAALCRPAGITAAENLPDPAAGTEAAETDLPASSAESAGQGPEAERSESSGQESAFGDDQPVFIRTDAPRIPGLVYKESMRLFHADQFSVDYYEGGYKYISVRDTGDFLLIPEGGELPALPADEASPEYTVLVQPLDSIYLAATSAMDFFDCLQELDRVTLSCEEPGEWDSDGANRAMEEGRMVYAGKYSAPDYEKIVSLGCDLALESTMIYHKPEVKEMLEKFGIPVLVEHSSYETDPLGRSEWIRFYGALLNREEKADELFDEMEEKVRRVLGQTSGVGDLPEEHPPEKRVAFFNINQQGLVTVRKAKDYVPAMIELAGGSYIFPDLGAEEENALSTVNLQMEEFYAGAKDADYLIYNSTIAGAIHSVDELLDKGPVLKDFRAVQEGNVWCTTQSLFQKPTGLADLIVDISRMLSGDRDGEYVYLYHVD